MGKLDKKVVRLKEQILSAEESLKESLTKKKHNTTEISVPALTSRIQKLKLELITLTKK